MTKEQSVFFDKDGRIGVMTLLVSLSLFILMLAVAQAMTITLNSPGSGTYNATSTRNINFTFSPVWFFGGGGDTPYENVSNCSLYSNTTFGTWDIVKNLSVDTLSSLNNSPQGDDYLVNGSAGAQYSYMNYTFNQDGLMVWAVACLNYTNASTPTNLTFSSNFIFTVDTVAPEVNTTFNATEPRVIGDGINYTANITDKLSLASANWTHNLSGNPATNAFYSISGLSAQISNATTFTRGGVFNFTIFATDSAGNVRQNSTIMTVTDNVAPVVNTTFNASTFRNTDVVNYTANITDETALMNASWITNASGVYVYLNVTISGTSAQVSNFTSLASLPGGSVVNFSIVANDISGNQRTNTTIITLTDAAVPIVNSTFNGTSYSIGSSINYTANVTDETALLSADWITNVSGVATATYTISGTSAQVSNITTFTSGGVFNFTIRVTDTAGNIRQNSTIISATDNVAPVVNTTFNASTYSIGTVVNYTANITDETALMNASWITNASGVYVYLNVTISGTSAQVSNSTTFTIGGVAHLGRGS